MKFKNYFFTMFVYVCCFVLVMLFIFFNVRVYSDKLVLINDKDELMKRLEQSIPIKIQVSNDKWGELLINDSKEILNIYKYIKDGYSIKNANVNSNVFFEDDNVNDKVDITISYINGKKSNWSIGNMLKIDGCSYGCVNNNPDIVCLKNKLLDKMYSVDNLCKFINENNKVVIVSKDKKEIKLGSKDKQALKKFIGTCSEIKKPSNLKKYIENKGEVLYQIRIYSDKEGLKDIKTSNAINVIVYENAYSVVVDLCNIKGNLIYISGNISHICKDIINRY